MKLMFLIFSLLLIFSLFSGNLYFFKHPNRFVREKSVTISAIIMVLYILVCLISVVFVKGYHKVIPLLCAISPFIIGRFAKYKTLTVNTLVQILVLIVGVLLTLNHF